MKESICLALGFFDSLHYGHRVIIDKLQDKAHALKISAVLSTFSDSFYEKNEVHSKLIYTFIERQQILKSLGIDNIILFDFDDSFKNQSAADFLAFLTDKYNIAYIVCGYDYKFGCGGKGDVGMLKEFCTNNNIGFDAICKVCIDGERVSSSKIKELLQIGNIEQVNRLLTDRYFISGKVIEGRGEGRLNGMPTANIAVSGAKLMPMSGVYATKTDIDGQQYVSITNVGAKPTYGDFSFGVETLISDFCDNIYGKEIKISFVKFIRRIQKFDSKESLTKQVILDMKFAKSL